MSTKKTKKQPHTHAFKIERGGWNPKTLVIIFLDMRCSCGMPLFVNKPTTHIGDGAERPLKERDIY